jgi:DNA-binding YbaB/EbfC family protein
MKAKLEKAQQELKSTILEAESGKGAVKVTIDGQQKIQSIKISPRVINPDKAEHLEELVLKAVSEALSKSQKIAAKRLGGLTGGLKIPGLT